MTAVTTVSLSASSAAAKRLSMPLMTWMGKSFSRSRSSRAAASSNTGNKARTKLPCLLLQQINLFTGGESRHLLVPAPGPPAAFADL